MNASQLATLKTALLADANVSALIAANNHIAISATYNQPGTGVIYRPSISAAQLNTAIVWSEYVLLTAVQQNAYQAMIAGGQVDGSSANIRAGFASIFATSLVTKANLIAISQRVPTKGEMVFTAANVCSAFGLSLTPNDIAQALGS